MAIPMMLGMSVNMIYNLTDTFLIGKLNDTHALAAISLLLPFATFLMAIGNLAAVIYYIICIQREGKQLSVSFMDFKIELAMLKENFSVGFSAMILDGLLIISSLMFNYYAMKYGDYVLAGFGISQKDSHISDRIDHRIGCRTVYISKIRCGF